MEKFMNFINKYGKLIGLFFILIIFFKTCGVNSNVESKHKKTMAKIEDIDSMVKTLPKTVLTKQNIDSLFEAKMWDFLELEEIADKKGYTISELKHKAKEIKDER